MILLNKRLPVPALAGTAEPFVAPGRQDAAAPEGRPSPRLAIIIDDIGYADLVADQLRDLGIPLTAL